MPLTKLEEDMPKMGWKKEITFDWLTKTRDGKYIKSTYYVNSEAFPCDICKTADYVWVQLRPTGVVLTCWGCKTTQGAMCLDVFTLLDRQEISLEEAYEIYKKTKQEDMKNEFTPEKLAAIERRKKQIARLKKRRRKK